MGLSIFVMDLSLVTVVLMTAVVALGLSTVLVMPRIEDALKGNLPDNRSARKVLLIGRAGQVIGGFGATFGTLILIVNDHILFWLGAVTIAIVVWFAPHVSHLRNRRPPEGPKPPEPPAAA